MEVKDGIEVFLFHYNRIIVKILLTFPFPFAIFAVRELLCLCKGHEGL